MATQSIGGSSAATLLMAKKPELIVVPDEYDYPATARCSACGTAMPLRQKWITSSAENLDWFADQFKLHVEKAHLGWSGILKNPA